MNAQVENRSIVPSPTNLSLDSVDIVSSSDGWAVGVDGTILRWQEGSPYFPSTYLIIIVAVLVVLVVGLLRLLGFLKSGREEN